MACSDLYVTRCHNQYLVRNFIKDVLTKEVTRSFNYAKRVLSGQYKEYNSEVTIEELKNEIIPYQENILDSLREGGKSREISNQQLISWLNNYISEEGLQVIFGAYFYVSERNGLIYEEVKGMGECIRLRGFPEIELHSFEEAKDFIKTRDDFEFYLQSEKEAKKKLKEFWEKYPNGLIFYG